MIVEIISNTGTRTIWETRL